MTETVLFVGGSMDGKRIVLREATSTLSVPVRKGFKFVLAVGDNRKCDIEQETYRHVAPHCYLISAESPDNLIPLLVEGYRGKDAERP
jgi:hypothetical protein